MPPKLSTSFNCMPSAVWKSLPPRNCSVLPNVCTSADVPPSMGAPTLSLPRVRWSERVHVSLGTDPSPSVPWVPLQRPFSFSNTWYLTVADPHVPGPHGPPSLERPPLEPHWRGFRFSIPPHIVLQAGLRPAYRRSVGVLSSTEAALVRNPAQAHRYALTEMLFSQSLLRCFEAADHDNEAGIVTVELLYTYASR